MPYYTVKSTSTSEHQKTLSLTAGEGASVSMKVHRYALVGKGDTIWIDPDHPRNIYSASREDPSDHIRISPHLELETDVRLGEQSLRLRVTEVTTRGDVEALGYLEQFHYKSFGSDEEGDTRQASGANGGRRAVLLAYLIDGPLPEPIGYIELQMPLMMVKPRHQLFDTGFKHPIRPIAWKHWDLEAIKRHVNAITRIARVVVQPEYRGLGISRHLIEAAKSFARQRWQVGGVRPLFIEISAEMLNYIDFVSRNGFVLVGRTEGNLRRVVKDLTHMAKGYEITSGIMSLQKKYLTAIERYCSEAGKDIDEVLARLADVVKTDDPMNALSASEWLYLRQVLRFPIPYYLAGLDIPSEEFLSKTIKGTSRRRIKFKAPPTNLELKNIRVASDYRLPETRNVRLILSCFGIKATHLSSNIIGPISLAASNGNIIFISGSSGTGKSVLLKALDPRESSQTTNLRVEVTGDQGYSCSWLRPLPSDVPIFDYFAQRFSAADALSALSQVGLSEAFAFVKPFHILSRGQRYRAMLAELLLRDDPVWLIDEFCADLDPLSARIVAHNVRKHVQRTGRIAFIAAANHGHFLDALRPTQVIQLRLGGQARFLKLREYLYEQQKRAS